MPGPDVAEIIRRHGASVLADGHWSTAHQRVLRDLASCRTSALGGFVAVCQQCGVRHQHFHSCGNRHCPRCQAGARHAWLEARCRDLLPVPYFHVVFTLPRELSRLALWNKRVVYGLLFRQVAATLQTIAADPKHLGARPGILAILHTWGQRLDHHPHVHCVVPGGGLRDGAWLPARSPRFLLPVRVLSAHFRRHFLRGLATEFSAGRLDVPPQPGRSPSQAFAGLLRLSRRKSWVVYCKPPFGGPELVLKYLARYTHRVAIANSRILSLDSGNVRFSWKDYRDGGRRKVMALDARKFVQRFLLHVLPAGFPRIRSYGFLANRCKAGALATIRACLGVQAPPPLEEPADEKTVLVPRVCSACGGTLIPLVVFLRRPSPGLVAPLEGIDSS